jgi:hypothetical protein
MEKQKSEKVSREDSADSPASKRAKVEEPIAEDASDASKESVCIVCMETDCSDRPLLDAHQCNQCSKDAWRICACCSDSLLSRTCPVCRGDYAPILLHVVPGEPLSKLADKTLTPEEKAVLLYKFGIVRHLIGKSNMAVHNPSKEQMHFSLPREFAEDSTDVNCLTVTIPMKAERIVDGTFTFNNAVWDEIEQEVEHGTVPTGEMMLARDAIQWLLSFTRHENHQILSMLPTTEWEAMLDPSKSQETAETLQSIKVGISEAGQLPAESVTADDK